jgi:hypothetical protein
MNLGDTVDGQQELVEQLAAAAEPEARRQLEQYYRSQVEQLATLLAAHRGSTWGDVTEGELARLLYAAGVRVRRAAQ